LGAADSSNSTKKNEPDETGLIIANKALAKRSIL